MIATWHVFAVSTIVAAFLLLGTVIWWTLLQPTDILTGVENSDALVVQPDTVKTGSTISVYSSICKVRPYSATVIRHFQDQLIYNLPGFQSNEKVGCTPNGYVIEIPTNLPPDTYTYRVQFVYRINPLKEVTYEVVSNPFKVVKE